MTGTPTGEAFGFFAQAMDGDPLDEPEAPETMEGMEPEGSEEEAAEEVPLDEVEEATETSEVETESEAPEGEGEPSDEDDEEPEHLYAGRYGDVEQLERGYRELQQAFTRASMQLRESEQREQERDQAIQALYAMIAQQRAAEDPEFAEALERQQMMQEAAAQQLGPMQQQLAQQQEALQRQQAIQAAQVYVQRFYAEHPDVEPGGELDTRMSDLVQRLGLDMFNPGHLETVYEAAKDQGLGSALLANPHWARSPEGLAYAKAQTSQTQPSRKTGGKAKAVRKTAHVETGSATPAPAPDKDEFDEAAEAWQGSPDESVFFRR